MSDTPKVSFAQAAKMLGVHINTLKNWQRTGRLSSAEKAKVKGVWTWLVDYSEAAQINRQGYTIIDSTAKYSQPPVEPPSGPPETANSQQGLMVLPEEAYNGLLSLIDKRDNTIKEQSIRLEEQAEAIGQLKERVWQLEHKEKLPTVPPATVDPQPAPAKRRWWQR